MLGPLLWDQWNYNHLSASSAASSAYHCSILSVQYNQVVAAGSAAVCVAQFLLQLQSDEEVVLVVVTRAASCSAALGPRPHHLHPRHQRHGLGREGGGGAGGGGGGGGVGAARGQRPGERGVVRRGEEEGHGGLAAAAAAAGVVVGDVEPGPVGGGAGGWR